jgi:PST family polysaccharide transporter
MVAVQIISFVAVAVLARQLSIRDFGLIALANLFLLFLTVFASQGVNQFIIYDRCEGFQNRARAAFWLNLAVSFFILATGLIAAFPVSRFFEEPMLLSIIPVLLVRCPFEGMTRIIDAGLNRDMKFRAVEIRDTLVQGTAAVASVVMALSGAGVWSLVIPTVVLSPLQTIVAFASSTWRPGWNPEYKSWPRILSFSLPVSGSTFTSFFITQGDTLFVGRLLGAGQLGLYDLAWRTSNLFSRKIVNVGNKLLFPVICHKLERGEALGQPLKRLLTVLSSVAFPCLVCLFILADDFVYVVYGAKWHDTILPLRILLIYAMRQVVGSPFGPVLNAIGRPDLIFKTGLLTLPFYGLAIWFGSHYGIIGVASGVTLVRTVAGLCMFSVVASQINESTLALLKPLRSPLAAASLMGLALIVAEAVLSHASDGYSFWKLGLLVTFAGATFFVVVKCWFHAIANEISAIYSKVTRGQSWCFRK